MTVNDSYETDDLAASFAMLRNTWTTLSATYIATRQAFLIAAKEAIAELPPVPSPPRTWTLDGDHSTALYLRVPAARLEVIPAEFQLDIEDLTVRISTVTGSSHLIALFAALTARLDDRLDRVGR